MATYKMDPDVERWGLHLLDVCTLASDTSRCAVTGYDADFSNVEYVREGYVRPCCSVENDEVIAHAYQEELSRLASAEAASGRRDFGDENLQASSILAQDWFGPSKRHESGNGWKTESDRDGKGTLGDIGNKEVTTMKGYGEQSVGEVEDCGTRINGNADTQVGSGYTYCIPGDNTGNIMIHGQDLDYVLEVTDESSLDSEVGRRLNDMVPVPHVPKTVEKIPSADEEISDHERLLERLQLYELIERKVQGDGNCQFRALSDQLYRSAEHHSFVREQIVQQLKGHPEMYTGYVPMAYADYLKKMNKSGEWGDHVTLQAASDWYGVKIFVITSFKDTCSIEILPHSLKSNRVIFLSFWAEVHYNSIYPEGELPEPCMKKKKKWWNIIS